LPGTSFHERVRDELGVKQNWLDSNDLAMLYRGPYSTEFYRQLHVVLHKEFRSRKHVTELRRTIRSPRSLTPAHARRVAALVFNRATLPLARRRLDALAVGSRNGLTFLEPALRRDAAATPSPQGEQ
jgi:anaerobic magnesium-protoporphyrin IX monomethyl ester cyclase